MTMNNLIDPIDLSDPRCVAAETAEKDLMEYYGLSYKVHYIDLDSPPLRIRVLEVGEGRPLLMVPGGTGEAAMYAAIMAPLKGWRMIAINRPGGGMSDGIDHRRIDLRELAINVIGSVSTYFGVEEAPIICNSMGGLWSIWYALEHPERVSALVEMGCPALALETSAPFFMRLLSVPVLNNFIAPSMQPDNVKAALQGLRFQGSSQTDIDRMPDVFAEGTFRSFNLPTYLDSWKTLIPAVTSLWGARSRYRLTSEAFKQLQCPALYIWGDSDPFGGVDVGRRIVELMADARLEPVEAGHLPFLDKPDKTGRLINRFLEKQFHLEPVLAGPV